jgi:hypothetical protein
VQLVAHVPFEHTSFGEQATPHAPQLAGSSSSATHAPQFVRPGPQVQLPELQLPPGPQLFPQAPQFWLSEAVSMQLLEHFV